MATDGEKACRLFLECTAAAEEPDDECDGADDDKDDWGVPDYRVWATDVDHVQVTDDGRVKLDRDTAAQQSHACLLYTSPSPRD